MPTNCRSLHRTLAPLALLAFHFAAMAAEICEPSRVHVFTVNEPIMDRDGQELALSVPSQMLIRPWFRWRNAFDVGKVAWVTAPFRERGISFGGGITLSAIYRGENGISEKTFNDYVTRDPRGRLYPAFGNPRSGYYHGSLANRKYLDYVLSFAKQQIDAGADNIFMDEVDGAYRIHEGFDAYGLAGFREWLVRRYVKGENWTETDARWTERFRIDLRDATICPDGTIRSFDYSKYLQKSGWAEQPDHKDNPLREEWGWPNDMRLGRSYCGERREQAWVYQCESLREHAKSKGRKVQIAANGINRHVDFQIQNLWTNVLTRREGRLDVSRSFVGLWRGALDRSRRLLGRDVPVMFFHDWGDGFPYWDQLNGGERKLWLRVYAPEIYASGAFFAFPVHGPFGCDARKDGSIDVIRTLAAFFDRHAALYRDTRWLSERQVAVDRPGVLCLAKYQPEAQRLLLHVGNRNCAKDALELAPAKDLKLSFPALGEIAKASVVSPESQEPAALTPATEAGRTVVVLPALASYALVCVEYRKLDPAPMAADVTIATVSAWVRPVQNVFEVGRQGVAGDELPNQFVQGQLHPHLRNNPTFVVDCPRPASFVVCIDRAADLGARIVILVDEQKVLEADLPGGGQGLASGAIRDYAIPLTAGQHRIRIDNPGRDWFSVDRFVLTGCGE